MKKTIILSAESKEAKKVLDPILDSLKEEIANAIIKDGEPIGLTFVEPFEKTAECYFKAIVDINGDPNNFLSKLCNDTLKYILNLEAEDNGPFAIPEDFINEPYIFVSEEAVDEVPASNIGKFNRFDKAANESLKKANIKLFRENMLLKRKMKMLEFYVDKNDDAMDLKTEVKNVLEAHGYVDVSDSYIDAAVEYIEMTRSETDEDYTVEQWFKDTKENYPEDLSSITENNDYDDIDDDYDELDDDYDELDSDDWEQVDNIYFFPAIKKAEKEANVDLGSETNGYGPDSLAFFLNLSNNETGGYIEVDYNDFDEEFINSQHTSFDDTENIKLIVNNIAEWLINNVIPLLKNNIEGQINIDGDIINNDDGDVDIDWE